MSRLRRQARPSRDMPRSCADRLRLQKTAPPRSGQLPAARAQPLGQLRLPGKPWWRCVLTCTGGAADTSNCSLVLKYFHRRHLPLSHMESSDDLKIPFSLCMYSHCESHSK